MKNIILTLVITGLSVLLAVSGGFHYLVYEGRVSFKPVEHAYTQADRDGFNRIVAKNSAADVFGDTLPGEK